MVSSSTPFEGDDFAKAAAVRECSVLPFFSPDHVGESEGRSLCDRRVPAVERTCRHSSVTSMFAVIFSICWSLWTKSDRASWQRNIRLRLSTSRSRIAYLLDGTPTGSS